MLFGKEKKNMYGIFQIHNLKLEEWKWLIGHVVAEQFFLLSDAIGGSEEYVKIDFPHFSWSGSDKSWIFVEKKIIYLCGSSESNALNTCMHVINGMAWWCGVRFINLTR